MTYNVCTHPVISTASPMAMPTTNPDKGPTCKQPNANISNVGWCGGQNLKHPTQNLMAMSEDA